MQNQAEIQQAFIKLSLGFIGKFGKLQLHDYFKKQESAGNLTSKQHAELMESIEKDFAHKTDSFGNNRAFAVNGGQEYINPMIHYVSYIVRHEWWQAVRGDDYLLDLDGSIFNMFDRLRIPASKGIRTHGMGKSSHVIFDQKKVKYRYDGKVFNHIQDIPGIGKINIVDGASFSSTVYLDQTAVKIGVNKVYDDEHNLRELKTVYHQITRDANGEYIGIIEKKHAEFAAIPGLTIEDAKTGEVIVEMVQEGNHIMMYRDNKGFKESIDQVSDLDAVKTLRGKAYEMGKSSSISLELDESSRRIIKTPHTKSSDTVYGPVQFLTSLNMIAEGEAGIQLQKFSEEFFNLLTEQSNQYTDLLHEASNDPDKMWEIVEYMFDQKSDQKHNLEQLLSVAKKDLVFHEGAIKMLKPVLLNMLIKRGAMQARTSGELLPTEGGTKGSNYYMKPGLGDRAVKKGMVGLSANNHVIWDAVMQKFMNDDGHIHAGYATVEWERESKQTQIQIVNEWMVNNRQKVITYRSPILQLAAIETRNIQMFHNDDGGAIYHHPEDVFRRLVGDHDIDEAGVILLDDKRAKIFEEFYATKFYQTAKTVNADINMADQGELPSFTSLKSMRQTMVDLLHGSGTQGMAAVAKNVASALSMKMSTIKFNDGTVVKTKKFFASKDSDLVVMDYMPIDPNYEQDIPPFAYYVNEDGKKWTKNMSGPRFLKTSAEHEFLLIANAAVDNLKKGTLTRVMDGRGWNWFVERIFTVEEGELTEGHMGILSELVRQYNYSSLRKLRTNITKSPMDMGLTWYVLKEHHDRLHSSVDKQKETILSYKTKKGPQITEPDGSLSKPRIIDLDLNDHITYEEKFVLQTYERFKELTDEGGVPLVFNTDRQKNTALLARQDLIHHLAEQGFTDQAVDIGHELAKEFAKDFYGKLEDLSKPIKERMKKKQESEGDQQSDEELFAFQAEYSEELFAILMKHLPSVVEATQKYGEEVHQIMTMFLLVGMGQTQYIKYFAPVEIYHRETLQQFGNFFAERWDKKTIVDGVEVLESLHFNMANKAVQSAQQSAKTFKAEITRCR